MPAGGRRERWADRGVVCPTLSGTKQPTNQTSKQPGDRREALRQLSGKEVFAAAAYRYDEEVLFTINYRADLTTACYVEYNGVKYSVTQIDTFEGYKQDITLYCKRM